MEREERHTFPTDMTVPGSIKVFDGAFQNMDKLTALTFEEGVEEIAENSMLRGCEALTVLNLPSSLKRITQPAAFSGASALESVTLPEGLVVSEGSLFDKCTSLKSVDLPASMTEIPSSTFSGCTSLTKVTAKSPITSIGSRRSTAARRSLRSPAYPRSQQLTVMRSTNVRSCPGPSICQTLRNWGHPPFTIVVRFLASSTCPACLRFPPKPSHMHTVFRQSSSTKV